MTYPYYGFPPPPMQPYYIPPTAPTPEALVGSIEAHQKAITSLKELLKDKPQDKKKEKTYNQKQMLAYMAIFALPIGFAQLGLVILILRSLGTATGLIQ